MPTERPTPGRRQEESLEAVGRYLRDRMQAMGIPGMAYAVVRGTEVVQRAAWGHTGDGKPVTARTPFVLGSVSKPFTALAVLRLVEEGAVDLDSPVHRHLPWFRPSDPGGAGEQAGEAASGPTVRQLLQHTSGVPTEAGMRFETDGRSLDPRALERQARELGTVGLAAVPGVEYHYSSANYLLLGALVERVTGRPFGEYLRHSVLDPLAMRDAVTGTSGDGATVPPGHRFYLGQAVRFDRPFLAAGLPYGYLAASVTDVAHFVIAQLGGGRYRSARVLSHGGIALSHRGTVDTGGGRAAQAYGLGWRVGTLPDSGAPTVWHAGSTPAYHAMVILLPASEEAVVVLQNASGAAQAPALNAAAFGAARILAGGSPDPAPSDPLLGRMPYGLLLLALGLTAALGWTLARRTRGRAPRPTSSPLRTIWRRVARPRARTRARVLAGTAAWVVPSLTLAAAAGVVVPHQFGGDLELVLLWAPAIGHALIAVVALSLALAAARLVLGIRRWRSHPDNGKSGA